MKSRNTKTENKAAVAPCGIGAKIKGLPVVQKETNIKQQKETYSYQTVFGDTVYTVRVRESTNAGETIGRKLERVITGDASLCVFSKGESI